MQDASDEHRRQMLTICQMDAMSSAARNGHVNVIKFLWENLGERLKYNLMDICEDLSILSKCVCEAANVYGAFESTKWPNPDVESVLRYVFSTSDDVAECTPSVQPIKTQLFRALLYSEAAALNALLKRGLETNNWQLIAELLNVYDDQQRSELRDRMTTEQAILCGLLTGNEEIPSIDSRVENALIGKESMTSIDISDDDEMDIMYS